MKYKWPLPNKLVIVPIMGCSCTGKSTMMRKIKDLLGTRVHLVSVGKMLRDKYPPEHFAGQMAPAHTQAEAWQMFQDGIQQGCERNADIILVDGQPRDLRQARDMLELFEGLHNIKLRFVLLTASQAVRKDRAIFRDGSDPKTLELSLARLENDIKPTFDVLTYLMWRGRQVQVIDTSDALAYTHTDLAAECLNDWKHLF